MTPEQLREAIRIQQRIDQIDDFSTRCRSSVVNVESQGTYAKITIPAHVVGAELGRERAELAARLVELGVKEEPTT
jgi:hypothetical protein